MIHSSLAWHGFSLYGEVVNARLKGASRHPGSPTCLGPGILHVVLSLWISPSMSRSLLVNLIAANKEPFSVGGIMNVTDAIKARKSVRSYLDKAIEDEELVSVLEAGRLAPSASNRQEWRFIIVRDKTMRKRISDAASRQSFVGDASAIIVACAETDEHAMMCGQQCYPIDVAIALDHITLAAVEKGLGTCWIGAFNEKQVKEILGVPNEIRIVGLMPIGYPADPSISEKTRLPFDRIVKYEHW